MLQHMRENFTGKFALVILGAIALSFVFVGLNYSFIGQQWAAKVDGEKIDAGLYEQRYSAVVATDPQLATAEGEERARIRLAVLERMIGEQLIDNYLRDLGYRATDSQVSAAIRMDPQFHVDGKFDMASYETALMARGSNPQRYEAQMRDNIRANQLQLAIGATGIFTPAEFRRYLNLVAEQRVVTVATIDESAVADEISITEDMIQAFYDDNPSLYQLPESADVAYIEVNRDMVADSIEVSEQELRELYEVSQDRYLQDEERVARHILLAVNNEDEEADKEALANDILAQLEAGESFDALAAEYSDDGGTAASGGVLGTITRSQMPGDLGAAIFSLEEGEVDGPVRSDFGFHIVRVDDILEQGPRPFEQVRAELLQELREGQVEDRFRELEQQLSDALFDHNDIDAIAEATGMEIQLIEGFTRAGGGDFADNQFVIDSIFDEAVLSGAQVTDIVEVDANRSAVFAVQNYNEATRQPLDEVRDRVVSSLRTQQADTLMSYRAEQVLAAIDAGEDFGEVAAAAGFSTAQPQIISRQDQNVDQLLMYEVFAAGKPGGDKPVYGRVRGLDGSYKVYTLDAVLPGRPEAIPVEQRDAELLRLKQQSGVGDLQAFLLYLYENADIVVNDNVVASATPFQ